MKIEQDFDYHEFLTSTEKAIHLLEITSKNDLEQFINIEIQKAKNSQTNLSNTNIKIDYMINLIKFKLVVITGMYDGMDKATKERLNAIVKSLKNN